jgi:hypothetical protein
MPLAQRGQPSPTGRGQGEGSDVDSSLAVIGLEAEIADAQRCRRPSASIPSPWNREGWDSRLRSQWQLRKMLRSTPHPALSRRERVEAARCALVSGSGHELSSNPVRWSRVQLAREPRRERVGGADISAKQPRSRNTRNVRVRRTFGPRAYLDPPKLAPMLPEGEGGERAAWWAFELTSSRHVLLDSLKLGAPLPSAFCLLTGGLQEPESHADVAGRGR